MSQLESNPFQAPIKSSPKDEAIETSEADLDFISLIKKWEWYRLIYNGILIAQTAVLGGLTLLLVSTSPIVEMVFVAIFGALTVNFFFFLGPAFDGYCQWFFSSRSKAFGLIILVLGTLFSMALAGVTMAGMAAGAGLPNQM